MGEVVALETLKESAGEGLPEIVALGMYKVPRKGFCLYKLTVQGSRVTEAQILDGPGSRTAIGNALKIAVQRSFLDE